METNQNNPKITKEQFESANATIEAYKKQMAIVELSALAVSFV